MGERGTFWREVCSEKGRKYHFTGDFSVNSGDRRIRYDL